MDQTKEFLEKSLLPALLSLLNVTKAMSDNQSKEHNSMVDSIKDGSAKTEDMQKAIQTFGKSVESLNKPITQLIESVNESNRLQAEQNKMIEDMRESLAQNTARVEAMNLALAGSINDPGITAIYKALEKEGEA